MSDRTRIGLDRRRRGGHALGADDQSRAVAYLTDRLRDDSSRRRALAARLLAAFDAPAVTGMLRDALAAENDPYVARELCETLGALHGVDWLRALAAEPYFVSDLALAETIDCWPSANLVGSGGGAQTLDVRTAALVAEDLWLAQAAQAMRRDLRRLRLI